MIERARFSKQVDAHKAAEQSTKKVRGRPFQPGNPGRPPGAKTKTTRLMERLMKGEAETLMRKAIDIAGSGKVNCLLYFLDRLSARRSGARL